MKKILALLLTAALVCCTVGCRHETAQSPQNAYHTGLSFSELRDSGTSAALELARAKELLFRIERGELSGIRAQQALDARTEALNRLGTDAAIAYVRYCLDVTDGETKKAYDTLYAQLNELTCLLVDASLLLSGDPALKEVYDAETVEALHRADTLSDLSVQPLIERERELMGEYEALPGKLRVMQFGREWTGDEILSDPTLSAEAFTTLYDAYLDLFNAEAGAIFLKLVDVRNTIAKTLGFDSYADYAYARYGRDYTPRDAARFSERVKAELVPLFREMTMDFYRAAGRLYGAVFDREPTMKRIKTVVAEILPELSEPWEYMISHGMYDLGSDQNRMPGCFTTYFAAYGTPFLFGSWTNGFDAPPSVIHEFGHFSAYFLNGDALAGETSLDLAEIDAQGLELLSVLRYDTIYGDLSDEAEIAQLFYALYALIDGCMEDAFQRFAYERESLTLEALNAEYGRLCAAYGMDLLGTEAKSWTQIQHTFGSPFYYVSYATSMTAALELYLLYRENPDAARNAYRSILMRGGNARFSETLAAAGIGDPFAADTIKGTAAALESVRRNRKNE